MPGQSLEVDFQQRFGTVLDEDSLNHAHQIIIIIVAAEAKLKVWVRMCIAQVGTHFNQRR